MKSKTEYILVECSFQDKTPLKRKIILKKVHKQELFFLHINGNRAGFIWVDAPSIKHLLTHWHQDWKEIIKACGYKPAYFFRAVNPDTVVLNPL